MQQVVRTMTAADDGLLLQHRVLICDRDTKWSAPVRARLGDAGIRVVQSAVSARPMRMPTPSVSCDRSMRSASTGVIPLGERHLRRTIAEYVEHYHHERNHQGTRRTH